MISKQDTFSVLSRLSLDLMTHLHYAGQVR